MRSCVDSCRIYTVRLSPALNGSSEIQVQCFERYDIDVIDRIFDSRTMYIVSSIVYVLTCSVDVIEVHVCPYHRYSSCSANH